MRLRRLALIEGNRTYKKHEGMAFYCIRACYNPGIRGKPHDARRLNSPPVQLGLGIRINLAIWWCRQVSQGESLDLVSICSKVQPGTCTMTSHTVSRHYIRDVLFVFVLENSDASWIEITDLVGAAR